MYIIHVYIYIFIILYRYFTYIFAFPKMSRENEVDGGQRLGSRHCEYPWVEAFYVKHVFRLWYRRCSFYRVYGLQNWLCFKSQCLNHDRGIVINSSIGSHDLVSMHWRSDYGWMTMGGVHSFRWWWISQCLDIHINLQRLCGRTLRLGSATAWPSLALTGLRMFLKIKDVFSIFFNCPYKP